jgi:hypothetical protein
MVPHGRYVGNVNPVDRRRLMSRPEKLKIADSRSERTSIGVSGIWVCAPQHATDH